MQFHLSPIYQIKNCTNISFGFHECYQTLITSKIINIYLFIPDYPLSRFVFASNEVVNKTCLKKFKQNIYTNCLAIQKPFA